MRLAHKLAIVLIPTALLACGTLLGRDGDTSEPSDTGDASSGPPPSSVGDGGFDFDACVGVDLSSDPAHCGDCAIICKPAETCLDGKCVMDPCEGGKGCSDGGGGITCVDVATDPKNCGACSHRCNFPSCAAGECERLVFATVKAYKASELGGLAGAAAKCQAAATGAQKATRGQFLPWISSGTTSPASAFTKSARPYRLGPAASANPTSPVVASSWGDLVDEKLSHAIDLDVNGDPLPPSGTGRLPVWTGTLANGTRGPAAMPCNGWTGAGAAPLIGDAKAINVLWTDSTGTCSEIARLYCFEQ